MTPSITQPILLSTQRGHSLGQAALFVEDDQGCYAWRPSRQDQSHGFAGGWKVTVTLTLHKQTFCRIHLHISPHGTRHLKRIFLRLPAGQHALPVLHTARTRMLLLPDDVFTEKGVIPLGKSRGTVVSRFLTVLHSDTSMSSFLAGVGGLAEDTSFFRVDGKTLEAGFEPARVLRKEEHYHLLFGSGSDPLELLDTYGQYMHRFGRTRHPSLAGWNSWDYYGASVTMDDLRQEMAALQVSPLRRKISHIVIDMGWWTDWGDIRVNRRFPSSMKAIAREITAAGFTPGIWMAPLQCSPWSYLGRHRQDLFAQAPSGGPATAEGQAILDWSNPEVLHLLYDWFSSFKKAGFQYFKLDYIYSDAIQQLARRYDDTDGLFGVIRRGLQTIRDAVGEESYILNCGAARECAVGITDASRICTDIHTFWSHIWHNACEIACHLWENGNLWNIDPDFALVRSAETSTDPFPNYIYQRRPWTHPNKFWMAGPEATLSELQVWLTVVHMTGGDVFLSDSITRLNRLGITTLAQLFPRLTASGRPVDMFLNPMPRFWLGRDTRSHRLAIFNWDDHPSPIIIPTGLNFPTHGVDVWTKQKVRIAESTVMPPRSVYLLHF